MNFEALPAGELMRAGLADAAAGRETLPSLLVAIDAAHSRYNALIRQLVSFERAIECGG